MSEGIFHFDTYDFVGVKTFPRSGVSVVAVKDVSSYWRAYVGRTSVDAEATEDEKIFVVEHGDKLFAREACALFPSLDATKYA